MNRLLKGAKRPAVEVSSNDENWIQNRWLSPIVDQPDLRQQVRRGRVLARRGVSNLHIRQGMLSAEVASESGESHSVKIRMEPIEDSIWSGVIKAISNEAALAADLIRGRISPRLAEIVEDLGSDLFPYDLRDVTSYCSCREDAKVCTGAVATHIHFAEAIQADPMKFLAFRGRDKARLEEEVKAKRNTKPQTPVKTSGKRQAEAQVRAMLSEEVETGLVGLQSLRDTFWERSDLPEVSFELRLNPPPDEESYPVVRALGPGPGDLAPNELAETFNPLLRGLQRRIESIFNRVEHESELPPPEFEPIPEPEPLDEVIVKAAYNNGFLTTSMVAQALGVAAKEARDYLQYLVTQGRLKVIGRARGTRYVPPDSEETDEDEAST